MKQGISYARISTENQKENSSIPTQLESIRKYAGEHDIEIVQEFIDSGITGSVLNRPALRELRDFAKSGQANVIIAYDPDRLSRKLVDLMVLANEFEESKVELDFVTQSVGKTPEDKILFGMKGLFAEYERTKILERTQRGRKARVQSGRLPGGGASRLYGYDYKPGKERGEGIRLINEAQSKVIKEIYRLCGEEGLSLYAITKRLTDLSIPSPTGNRVWNRTTVYNILTNESYRGRTFAFTTSREEGERHYKADRKTKNTHVVHKPREHWVEIEGVTPAIIDEDLFKRVRACLKRNKELAKRNGKKDYLLSGYVFCSHCNRRFLANIRGSHSYYRCPKCENKIWRADYLEDLIWERIEELLIKPEMVIAGIEAKRQEGDKIEAYSRELETVKLQLKHTDKEKDRAWKAFILTGDEAKFTSEIKAVTSKIEGLEQRKSEIERHIEVGRQSEVNIEGIKESCDRAKSNLADFTFQNRRLALEALNIRVRIDGDYIAIEGIIPIESTLLV